MRPQVRFCTTSDNVRIAYSRWGEGPPLLFTCGWVSHLDVQWEYEPFQLALEELGRYFSVVAMDKRGTGLSERNVSDFSLDARVRDVEAVADHLALDQFAIHAISEAGPVVLAYAARNPDRVSRLALFGAFTKGNELVQPEVLGALIALIEAEWGMGSQSLASLFMPNATPESLRWFTKLQNEAATGQVAAALLRAAMEFDVSAELPNVLAPTLLGHARGDRAVPFDRALDLARALPNARFLPFDSDDHFPDGPTATSLAQATVEFLLEDERISRHPARRAPAAAGSVTLLFSDVEGSTALTERLGDAGARDLLRTHEGLVRKALAAHEGTELKTMGDGFMATFSSATQALECAISIQRAFAEHNESAAESLLVRVGLNAGEPIAEDDDFYGTAVNLAARVASSAVGGEIMVSEVVRHLVAGKGFLFADRGDVVLRGFEDPVRLYEARWQD